MPSSCKNASAASVRFVTHWAPALSRVSLPMCQMTLEQAIKEASEISFTI
jgi:hypothetical protein